MRGISVLLYSIRQSFKNIRQNRMFTLASIGTIAACLFLFGLFFFVAANFRYMVENVGSTVGLTVFFDEDLDQAGIDDIGEKIRARSEVDRIEFISADDAWEKFKNDTFGDEKESLTETFGDDNPLKDSSSYEIYLKDISKQSQLVKYIKGLDGVREVNSSERTAAGLTKLNKLVGYASASIIIILLAVSIFLINTTITMAVSVRKEEISIMKLIGATDTFIGLPFVFEGIFIGVLGAAIPLFVLYFLYGRIIEFISERFAILSNILVFMDVNEIFNMLVPVCLVIGVGIGYIGSLWTLKKHMRT